jgi:LPXTG-motif cell wall-anchored protein
MSPFYKATIAPRLLIMVGMVTIASTVFIPVTGSTGAMMEIAGGAVALAGAIWFIITWRRFRKA